MIKYFRHPLALWEKGQEARIILSITYYEYNKLYLVGIFETFLSNRDLIKNLSEYHKLIGFFNELR